MSDKTIVSLTEKEVANVLDALEEWLLFVGPKELTMPRRAWTMTATTPSCSNYAKHKEV